MRSRERLAVPSHAVMLHNDAEKRDSMEVEEL
jgi:hypothetical protein